MSAPAVLTALVAMAAPAAVAGQAAMTAPAAAPPVPRGAGARLAAYSRLVEEYARGDADEALRQVVSWPPSAVDPIVRAVTGSAKARPNSPVAIVREAFPAAVMLHTEAGLYLNWRGTWGDAAQQWRFALKLAELEPARAEQDAFLRAWNHALGVYLLGFCGGAVNAAAVLAAGHERFPDDVPIALALGQAHEALGSSEPGATLVVQGFSSRDGMHELRVAEDLFRGLLARDPPSLEAKLRLGRILLATGRADAAVEALADVAEAGDARQRYLAQLFIAQHLRREGRLAEARERLEKALASWPRGQAGAVELAEILHRQGERSAAASVLTAAIEDSDGRAPGDPARTYYLADRVDERRFLEAVKAMARR